MDEFPGNSNKEKQQKQEPKKIEPIVQGAVVQRKPSLGKRFAQNFFGGDLKTAATAMMLTVLIPSLKDTLRDMADTGLNVLFDGKPGKSRSKPSGNDFLGHQQYQQMFKKDQYRGGRDLSRKARSMHDFAEIVLESRAEAEQIIDTMFELLQRYDMVRVRELYGLLDINPGYTDEKYGWYDLKGAGVVRLRGGGGYLLDLPQPVLLD